MTNKKPLVVVTRRLPELVETRMRELFDARLNVDDKPMSQAEIVEAMREADVLVPTITDHINAAMIAQAGEQMKLIANFGNGVDHIDVTSALRRGITVTNTPGVLTEDTADMTMALILSTARRVVEGSRIIPEGHWAGWAPTWMLGRRITGKRLGIVGMGRIGQALARRARAFGMSIHYHNRRRVAVQIEETLEATYWDSLDQMLARMDFVSINCPHTPGTFHLLSARRLKYLRPDAILINTARGEVVDENALIRMLEADELASAGLDVYEHAPAVNEKLIALAKAGKVTLLAAYGLGDARGPGGHGREGHRQHPHLRRRPPPARPRAAQHALRAAREIAMQLSNAFDGAAKRIYPDKWEKQGRHSGVCSGSATKRPCIPIFYEDHPDGGWQNTRAVIRTKKGAYQDGNRAGTGEPAGRENRT